MKQRLNARIWIPLLMTVSGLLLTAFVVQWLYTQQRSLNAEIQKDVKADTRKTGDQLLDSLVSQFIGNDFSTVTIEEFNGPKSQEKRSSTRKIITGDTVKSETLIDVQINNQEIDTEFLQQKTKIIQQGKPGDSSPMVTMHTQKKEKIISKSKQDLLTHGLSLVVERMSSNASYSFNSDMLDTNVFKKLLAENWQHKGLEYRFYCTPSSLAEKKNLPKSVVYTGIPVIGKSIGIELTNRNYYVFSTLFPQILFAFILLSITAGAFVVAYRSYRKQVRINELRTHFINNISHELKTPVSTVRVALEALQNYNRKNDPKVMDEYLELMSMEVTRLDKLVHQVLVNGQLELKKNFLNREKTDVVALINQVIQNYEWKIVEAGAKVVFLKPDAPLFLYVDPIHLHGVMGNLLENALNYAVPNPEIEIRIQQTETTVRIEVADNGPGIDKAYLDQLFTQFFRVPSGNTHNVKGYGLGLSYCKQIMLQHGGDITVSNLTGGGCIFQLTFPTQTS
ncbi:MAG: HAMP domain-containing sensor histidine kinase [Fluviicola sp.]|nr:HAMP domain-containing sensor histidine kinase [Fluviicola sp.]